MLTKTRKSRANGLIIDPFTAAEIKRLVAEFGSPLLIIDCQRVREQYRKLHKALPGVDLHYALKPLPHPAVVETIVELGGWLDLATTGETQLVTQLGIDPARCIHTHPIKRDIDIRNALHLGVKIFVADNPDEVRKFEPYRDQCELLLRVSFRVPGAVVRPVAKVRLRSGRPARARAAGAQARHPGARPVVPRRFAGGGCRQTRRGHRGLRQAHGAGAPREARRVRHARHRRRLSHRIRRRRWPTSAASARRSARRSPNYRQRCASSPSPAANLAVPRPSASPRSWAARKREGHWWYYLDDGLYGSYSGQLFDHAKYPVESLKESDEKFPSVLAGPTCDSIDVIAENLMLPALKAGDLIVGRAMGAYTWASASEFNFFPKATVVSVNRKPGDTGSVIPLPF